MLQPNAANELLTPPFNTLSSATELEVENPASIGALESTSPTLHDGVEVSFELGPNRLKPEPSHGHGTNVDL
jgi:hypothetical protein